MNLVWGTRLQDDQFHRLCIYLQRISWTSHWWGTAPSGELPRQCCCEFVACSLYPFVAMDQVLLNLLQGMKTWVVAWDEATCSVSTCYTGIATKLLVVFSAIFMCSVFVSLLLQVFGEILLAEVPVIMIYNVCMLM